MKKHLEDGFYKVAEYIRLSREDGDKAESDSIGNQRKLITNYIAGKEEFILYDTYEDDGFTGTNYNRPAFKRMLTDIEDGKVNCVVVKDLSRFGRDYIDTGNYLERYFPDNDVRFISITDNIDSMKQAYDMLLPIKNIFNEQYSRDISRKIHASMKTKQEAGEFIGAFASYGYRKSAADKNKLVIDHYAAEIVRRVFNMYIEGYGKNSIANTLNKEGIVCPSEYKKRNGENYRNCNRLEETYYWTYSTISRMLKNEMYAGNMVQGRKTQHMRSKQRTLDKEEWIIVEGTHEAIIDSDTWNKVQNLLKQRTRSLGLDQNKSMFAGYLKCGDCGRSLVKKSGGKAKGDGGIKYYCGTYVRSGRQYCTPHPLPSNILEKIILDDLNILIENTDSLQDIVKNCKNTKVPALWETDRERTRLNAELDKVRKLKKAIYEDYREELITKEEFITYKRGYLQKEELIRKQLESIGTNQYTQTAADFCQNPWIQHLLEQKGIHKLNRDIVAEMIKEIKVFENHRIKITYRFSGEQNYLFLQN